MLLFQAVNVPAFAFGKNWLRFAETISDSSIEQSAIRLSALVGDIRGKTFLDVGCGSGIHSLAALRLGASRVHSFDYDPDSVRCTMSLRKPSDNWSIETGSALDEAYLHSLGNFDIVYAWGVLHHTGDMWKALDLVTIPAAGRLVVAIYHDQGWQSQFWRSLKRRYVRGGFITRKALELFTFTSIWGGSLVYHTLHLRPWVTFSKWRNYKNNRGMSPWTDALDWAGGYPFEFARPEQIAQFYKDRGFSLEQQRLCGNRAGNNEFVFQRISSTKN